MIKFFRKIRQNLLMENKIGKYFKYAIGEIILVVMGILIALQINNWNEDRKNNQSVKTSIKALLEDLKRDTIQLNFDFDMINEDLERLNSFRVRLSKPTATIDTLRKIARFEYLPFFNPSNELNRNTIVSLLNTGKIENFKDEVKNKILNHNSEQLKELKIMDQNVSIYLNNQTKYSELIAVQSEHEIMNDYVVKGPLLNKYWQSKDDEFLMEGLLTIITSKSLMNYIIKERKNNLLESTKNMINFLEELQAKK